MVSDCPDKGRKELPLIDASCACLKTGTSEDTYHQARCQGSPWPALSLSSLLFPVCCTFCCDFSSIVQPSSIVEMKACDVFYLLSLSRCVILRACLLTLRCLQHIVEKYYQRLTLDFATNKRICEEVSIAIPNTHISNRDQSHTVIDH